MSERKEYTLEDILSASERGEIIKAPLNTDRSIIFRTKLGVTLGLSDSHAMQNFIEYIEKAHNVHLRLIGGGYGCTKFNYVVEGNSTAVELTKQLLRDKEFRSLAKEADLELLITIDNISRIHAKEEIDKISQASKKAGNVKGSTRVSSDGTVQEV